MKTPLIPKSKLERQLLLVVLGCLLAPLGALAILAARDGSIDLMAQVEAKAPFLILLIVCLASLLTFRQIHRRLAPLEELVEKTRDPTRNALDAPLPPAGNDEVHELASSFDAMAQKLGLQLTCMSTTIEISRLVVSAIDTRGIVGTLLQHVRDLYPCDFAAVALMSPEPPHPLRIYLDTEDESSGRQCEISAFTEEEVSRLYEASGFIEFGDGESIPHYLEPLCEVGARASLVVPLFFQGDLTGLIALGQRDVRDLDSARAIFVRQLADQTSTALGNAQLADENRTLAYFDALTGLPNRRLYNDRLEQALIFARRRSGTVATCLLDLDGFKRINESLGHQGGDLLLREVSARLLKHLRLTDAVARASVEDADGSISRLGGDEYTFLLTEIAGPQDAGRVAQRVLDSIAEPFHIDGQEIYATASIGIAVHPSDGGDAETLLLNAGTALSSAKSRGRNHFQYFAKSMNLEVSRRLHLESRLRQAMDRDELFLHYQPIRDVSSGELTGAEALLRWDDPEMGLVPPAEFIPVAEETNVMGPLGLWVLRSACTQAMRWRAAGYRVFRLSVNLSARQLRDRSLVEDVDRVLRETGLSADDLELEITESAILGEDETTRDAIRGLQDLGIRVALDDFGTGYSSLSYLRRFAIDRVKIDRAFVSELPGNSGDAALTAAIIAMAHGLEIPVVAEGVETLDQVEFLREQGCEEIQGYVISPPVGVDEFPRFLGREKDEMDPPNPEGDER